MAVELREGQGASVEEEALMVDPEALAGDWNYKADILERINSLTVMGIPERLGRLEERWRDEEIREREQIEAVEDTRHWGITELDFSS